MLVWDGCRGTTVSAAPAHILKLLHVVVGQHVGLLQVLLGVERVAHQTLPEGTQEVQRKRHVCTDGYAQKLTEEVQQLLLGIAYGARRQDVLSLQRATHNSAQRGRRGLSLARRGAGGPLPSPSSRYLVAVGCGAGAGEQQGEDGALQLLTHLPQEVPEGAAWQQTSQTGSREKEL